MDDKGKDSLYGWVVCAASFTGQALSVGFFFAFGTIYVALIKEFKIDETQAAWIGSLAYSLCFLFGFLTSILCKRFGGRIVMVTGGIIYGLGFIISSFAQHYALLFVSYGVVVGFGASVAFFCSLLVLPLYFEKRLAFANGIVSAGSGFGGLIISPSLECLLRRYGFRNTMRIYSVSAILMILGGLTYTRNYPGQSQGQQQKLIDKTLFKNKAYLIWSSCLCLILFGYYIPYVHLVHLAEEIGISTQNASYLLSFASVSQIAGKLFFGKLADSYRSNRLSTYQLGLLALSLSVTLCPLSRGYAGLVVFSIVFGFFEGCFSCYIIVITSDCVKRDQINVAFGMLYSASSVFSLVGPPFAGFIYTSTGSYLVAFVICGGNITLSILAMFLIPWFIPEEVTEEKLLHSQLIQKRDDNSTENQPKAATSCYQAGKVRSVIRRSQQTARTNSLWYKSVGEIIDSYSCYAEIQSDNLGPRGTHFMWNPNLVVVDRVSCV